MALWQVSVNVRAYYEVEAKSQLEAERLAIREVESNKLPDEIEYAGDGCDNCVCLKEDAEDAEADAQKAGG